MPDPNFGIAACPLHQSGEFSTPWLACRFAHICEACEKLIVDQIHADYEQEQDMRRFAEVEYFRVTKTLVPYDQMAQKR